LFNLRQATELVLLLQFLLAKRAKIESTDGLAQWELHLVNKIDMQQVGILQASRKGGADLIKDNYLTYLTKLGGGLLMGTYLEDLRVYIQTWMLIWRKLLHIHPPSLQSLWTASSLQRMRSQKSLWC